MYVDVEKEISSHVSFKKKKKKHSPAKLEIIVRQTHYRTPSSNFCSNAPNQKGLIASWLRWNSLVDKGALALALAIANAAAMAPPTNTSDP